MRYQAEVYLHGYAERPFVLTSVDTLWDATRAPQGKHLVGVEEFAAPRRMFVAEQWAAIKRRFSAHLLDEWQRYAPNMTPDNVIASACTGPTTSRTSGPT